MQALLLVATMQCPSKANCPFLPCLVLPCPALLLQQPCSGARHGLDIFLSFMGWLLQLCAARPYLAAGLCRREGSLLCVLVQLGCSKAGCAGVELPAQVRAESGSDSATVSALCVQAAALFLCPPASPSCRPGHACMSCMPRPAQRAPTHAVPDLDQLGPICVQFNLASSHAVLKVCQMLIGCIQPLLAVMGSYRQEAPIDPVSASTNSRTLREPASRPEALARLARMTSGAGLASLLKSWGLGSPGTDASPALWGRMRDELLPAALEAAEAVCATSAFAGISPGSLACIAMRCGLLLPGLHQPGGVQRAGADTASLWCLQGKWGSGLSNVTASTLWKPLLVE